MSALKLWSACQDGGLWLVGLGEEDQPGFCTLGYVWNEGYLVEERKGLPYRACLGWDSCVPVEVIGQSATWLGAVNLLRWHREDEQEPLLRAIATKHHALQQVGS